MTVHVKHVPIRMCVVCRDKSGKRTMTRLVRTDHGLKIDTSGKANGRGAYLCDSPDCWKRVVTTDVLSQALRSPLTDADRDTLRQHIV